MHKLRGIIVGTPNIGKSSIFNKLTSQKSAIGNWAGVTVSAMKGLLRTEDDIIELCDLPGIYSLESFGEMQVDEKITIDTLLSDEYDFIVNVIDATSIESSMMLTLQLCELQKPMMIVLNKIDLLTSKEIDITNLSKLLGLKILCVSANKKSSIHSIKHALIKHYDESIRCPGIAIKYNESIESVIEEVSGINRVIRLLSLAGGYNGHDISNKLHELYAHSIESKYKESVDILIAASRFEVFQELLSNIQDFPSSKNSYQWLDNIFLNKSFGYPIFFAILYSIFSLSIFISNHTKDFLELMTEAFLLDFPLSIITLHPYIEQVYISMVNGASTVIGLTPIVGSLYFCLAFLQSSGYLARVTYLFNRPLKALNLPSNALIPLIVGFGCNIPSIYAMRTVPSRKHRIVAILMAPFMSCGARLIIYSTLCAIFFKEHAALIILSLYLIGIIVAILTGLLAQKIIDIKHSADLLIELPMYHLPRLKELLFIAMCKVLSFCKDTGKMIVLFFAIAQICAILIGVENKDRAKVLAQQGMQILAPIGIEPNNWEAGAALAAGIIAKEAVIGAMAALYNKVDTTEDPQYNFYTKANMALDSVVNVQENDYISSIQEALQLKFQSKIAVYAYLLFILLYFPCISVFAAITTEIGLSWAIASSVWSTGVAYIVATLFYQIARIICF